MKKNHTFVCHHWLSIRICATVVAKRVQQWTFFSLSSLFSFSTEYKKTIDVQHRFHFVSRLFRSRFYVLIVAQRVWTIVSDSMTMVKILNGFFTSILIATNLIIFSMFVAKRIIFVWFQSEWKWRENHHVRSLIVVKIFVVLAKFFTMPNEMNLSDAMDDDGVMAKPFLFLLLLHRDSFFLRSEISCVLFLFLHCIGRILLFVSIDLHVIFTVESTAIFGQNESNDVESESIDTRSQFSTDVSIRSTWHEKSHSNFIIKFKTKKTNDWRFEWNVDEKSRWIFQSLWVEKRNTKEKRFFDRHFLEIKMELKNKILT